MVNGLLGADVPTDQPLMEAGLDSIGAHQTMPRFRLTLGRGVSAWMWRHPAITVDMCLPAEQMPPTWPLTGHRHSQVQVRLLQPHTNHVMHVCRLRGTLRCSGGEVRR